MLAPIDFNDQTLFPANKVHDVRSDGLLPDEFQFVERTRTETIPKSVFGNGGISAQPSRRVRLCDLSATHEAALTLQKRTSLAGESSGVSCSPRRSCSLSPLAERGSG